MSQWTVLSGEPCQICRYRVRGPLLPLEVRVGVRDHDVGGLERRDRLRRVVGHRLHLGRERGGVAVGGEPDVAMAGLVAQALEDRPRAVREGSREAVVDEVHPPDV